jgi:ectoine hydroxylase-related dioxygenase (phytanoyl-CoA dioxygenase family)
VSAALGYRARVELPVEPLRPVTSSEIEQFWADGVVVLRGVLPAIWLDALVEPLERTITHGEAVDLGTLTGGAPDRPQFNAGVDHWRHDETFAAFALRSPLAPIVASLLRSDRVVLWEDSVLVKEPGTPFETRFHTDAGYFHCDGEQICTVWVPLDAATPESGMVRWVRGSHHFPDAFRPNLFVTDEPIDGTHGQVVPDVLGTPELASRVVTFDVEPGDITVHHARTLHGAPANCSQQRRRAVSVRYCGDDARYLRKPGLAAGPELASVADGDPVGPPSHPVAWPRA